MFAAQETRHRRCAERACRRKWGARCLRTVSQASVHDRSFDLSFRHLADLVTCSRELPLTRQESFQSCREGVLSAKSVG